MKPQVVLQVHNEYRHPGGEDAVVAEEASLLRRAGLRVEQFKCSNREIPTETTLDRLVAVKDTLWNSEIKSSLQRKIDELVPDVVHVHNTFARLSDAAFWVSLPRGCGMVWTLHNYRFTCANAQLLREGEPCDICVGSSGWAGVRHACYRGSRALSGVHVANRWLRSWLGTIQRRVDVVVALTPFMRDICIRSGFPKEKVLVKPNGLPGDVTQTHTDRSARVAFVGRVTTEKGLDIALSAWAATETHQGEFLVVGDGPQAESLREEFRGVEGVRWLGWRTREEVSQILREVRAVVVPSRWYEGMPMTVLEGFRAATPVVAPRHGPFPDLLEAGRCGWLFDGQDGLRECLSHIVSPDGVGEARKRGNSAAAHFLTQYSSKATVRRLMETYSLARSRAATRRG